MTQAFDRQANTSPASCMSIVLAEVVLWTLSLFAGAFGDEPRRDSRINDLPRTAADRRALGAIFNEVHIADTAIAVHRQAMELPLEARYEYLSRWVLPSIDHDTLRLALDFTPTNPVPSASGVDPRDAVRLNKARDAGETRVQTGGHLVSPAFDLVEAATELGRLAEVRQRVEQASAASESQQRLRLAMLVLIDLALQDFDAALASLERLSSRVQGDNRSEGVESWPETLAVWQGVRHPATRDASRDLLVFMLVRDVRTPPDSRKWEPWRHFLAALSGQLKYRELQDAATDPLGDFSSAPTLKNWSPVSRATAQSRGQGMPSTHWHLARGTVESVAGHDEDYLYYHIPLRGHFELECDISSFNWRDTHLFVAGTWVAPEYDLSKYRIGNFRESLSTGDIHPPLSPVGNWLRYRTVVRDGVCTTYVNGRPIHRMALPPNHEPWVAIRSPWYADGGAREFRIAGQPHIPDDINLSSLPDLRGWISYYDESVGESDAQWQHESTLAGGGIIGRRRPELSGSGLESLLHYHRPMLEDGTIEYEFFYQDGKSHTHPALDRLVFLLEPNGVRIHWVTDGVFDRTDADPMNIVDEPQNRRGPDKLPLKPNAWNHLALDLSGSSIDLSLNGQFVYRRELEANNQRTFGLFHYADQTEVQVRNIVWRGDWPKTLPAIEDQELARAATDSIDAVVPRLTAVFEHDFANDGLPLDRFSIPGDWKKVIVPHSDGLHVNRPGIDGYADRWFATRMRIHGDFDITATFDDLTINPTETGSGGIALTAVLENESLTHARIYRGTIFTAGHPDQRIMQSEFTRLREGKFYPTWIGTTAEEATSGRLRLARRGDAVHCLFAEGDSPHYRLVHTELVGSESLLLEGVRLYVQVQSSPGNPASTTVVWKDLTIRAERITERPVEPPALFLMSTQGKEVRQLTRPIGDLGSHASPTWSPDGRRIAFDTFKDSTADSHIYLINADGSELKDLGLGSMPTFSPDGKRIAFSWAGRGITVMDADGSNREILDPSGWGAQWSPDGKSIAYGGNNITLLDLATKRKRTILEGEQADRYSFTYWNMSWSRDSSRICFKGRTKLGERFEIAVADAAGSSKGFKVLYAGETESQTDFSWHPDGEQILCSMHEPGHGGQRLFTLDVNQAIPPKLLPNQPLDQNNTNPDWSPDGKSIVFSSKRPH